MIQKFRKYFKRKGVCRSTKESEVYQDLENRCIPFEYETVTLEYTTPPVNHKYVPDFKIGNIFVAGMIGFFFPLPKSIRLFFL